MDKLTMAHDFAMKLVGNPSTPLKTMESIVDVSWQYADAMQAEADKREDKTKSELSWIRALELVSDLGIEYVKYLLEDNDATEFKIHSNGEGEDYIGAILADDLKRIIDIHEVMEGCGKEEWQPDWSQAPEWANWWAMDGFSKKANWYIDKPYLDDDSDVESEWNIDLKANTETYMESLSFGYQGHWKDSLRKRP